MLKNARPRRSMLYMPGSNTRALDKGRSLPADALILDLEDAVAPDTKAQARANIVEALRAGGYGRREIVVRTNGLDSEWGRDDIAALAAAGANALLLPKVESAAMVQEAEALMVRAGAPETLGIMCMMETPLGILRADEIAGASKRLTCLVMGTSDLVKDLNAAHTPERLPVLTSLSLCVLAARAHGLAIVDGVHLDLDDAEGFAAHCLQGKQLGFDGKTLIHPKTLAKTNEVFAPSAEEVAQAHRIIEAHAAAVAEGKGVVVLDGKLVENLHVESAKRSVALAEAIAELEADAD
ncbi:HpcH/HpaI aldolase/citrate lyase family protein [Aquibaculum arenosum]|uniref:CoA ester lyase n=1 Tax=Aquibaculum arenosum TaxID=3032591 RepID=A0ABT5YHK2_9PROT|nr:CoA ester lyase [Fodinicurvata sp. CAU 1616]MDF2094414.1 CoA ester lyase [Fodinicurvata sp. CAU 1616]